jgi:hypothetical protein
VICFSTLTATRQGAAACRPASDISVMLELGGRQVAEHEPQGTHEKEIVAEQPVQAFVIAVELGGGEPADCFKDGGRHHCTSKSAEGVEGMPSRTRQR